MTLHNTTLHVYWNYAELKPKILPVGSIHFTAAINHNTLVSLQD